MHKVSINFLLTVFVSLSIGFGPFGKRSAAYVGLSLGASTFQDLNYVYN